MHRVKGLEFDHVIVAGVNKGVVPLSASAQCTDEFAKVESDTKERALL